LKPLFGKLFRTFKSNAKSIEPYENRSAKKKQGKNEGRQKGRKKKITIVVAT
jgi:hypothetical protein